MPVNQNQPPLRGTQLLVEHIGTVIRRPGLIAIEVCWRWLFGIPFVYLCAGRFRQLFADYPLDASGFNLVNSQDPWGSAAHLGHVVAYYEPHVADALRWLMPVAALAWVLISGLGRMLLLHFLVRNGATRPRFRPLAILTLQAVWLCMLCVTFWAWFVAMRWAWVTHVPAAGDPDLVGYFMWAIFLTLGFFTAWALVSWTAAVAPLLVLSENRSTLSALAQSLRLGKAFSGKLAEINLVLGIVKLALMVLAMVFSAAPLPFSDELGPQALHVVWGASFAFFLIADDIFQVVRLKAFAEFWKLYRGRGVGTSAE